MARQSAIVFAATIAYILTVGHGIMPNAIGNDTYGESRDLVQRALPSFTITSRPLIFSHENSQDSESGERKTSSGATPTQPWPWQKTPRPTTASAAAHSTKVSLTFLPGKATVVCKGIACSQPGGSFSSSASSASHFGFYGSDAADDDDEGFAGEAIPFDGGEDFATVVLNEKKPVLLPATSKPKRPTSGSASTHTSTVLVHLLTKRPYLNRVKPSTVKRSTTPTISYIRKRSTTTSSTTRVRRRTLRSTSSTSTTKVTPLRRRPVADVPSTTTRQPPQAAPLSRPGGGGSRPSFFFPAAMTAFTMMALPMAAAAIPFLLQVAGRKRRSAETMEEIRALQGSQDFETLVRELEKILEKNADDRTDVSVNGTSGEDVLRETTAVSSPARHSTSLSQIRPETEEDSALAARVVKRPKKRAAI